MFASTLSWGSLLCLSPHEAASPRTRRLGLTLPPEPDTAWRVAGDQGSQVGPAGIKDTVI